MAEHPDSELAIQVDGVTKIYRLYNRQRDRLWESLGLDFKKNYREKYALNNVSLQVYRGQTVGIIGTNGSGKSTMLKLITGVLTPTGGSIKVRGRISALLELGAGFNMEYTGIENIYLNGIMTGFSKEEIDARLKDIIDFADIGDYVNQPVKSYSSGMFVRLAFAVAINIDPEILIVDEALSVGDVFFQSKCYRKFEDFRSEGKTILFVSHDLSAISRYCDRAVLLNQGEKIYEGPPKEAIDIYKKVLVGQFRPTSTNDTHYTEKSSEECCKTSGQCTSNTFSGTKMAEVEIAEGRGENGAEGRRENENEGLKAHLRWKDSFAVNPALIEYGEMSAEISDYALLDENGLLTSTFLKGSRFTVRMKIVAHASVSEPIFAFTIKNLKGIEICGTNTAYEKVMVDSMKEGDVHVVEFTQNIDLLGGDYLLSLGCTGYQDGIFRVFHRLYDVILLTVVSDKDTVGFYDMNSICALDPEIRDNCRDNK